MAISPYCPTYAPFFGFLGAALALVFGNMGAAYGTWKSALGLATIAKLPRHKVQTELVDITSPGCPARLGVQQPLRPNGAHPPCFE